MSSIIANHFKTYTNEFNEYKVITANAIKHSICKWILDKSARTRIIASGFYLSRKRLEALFKVL